MNFLSVDDISHTPSYKMIDLASKCVYTDSCGKSNRNNRIKCNHNSVEHISNERQYDDDDDDRTKWITNRE
jgi:hypothetical protein